MAEHVHTTPTSFVRRRALQCAEGSPLRRDLVADHIGVLIPFPGRSAPSAKVMAALPPPDRFRIDEIIADVEALPVADLMRAHDHALMMPYLFDGEDFRAQCRFKAMLCLCRLLDTTGFPTSFGSAEA